MAINDGIPPCVCQQLIPQIVELFDAYGWWLIIGLIDSILFLSATNTGTFRPTLIVNLHSQKKCLSISINSQCFIRDLLIRIV